MTCKDCSRPYDSLYDGRVDRLSDPKHKLVYLIMAACCSRWGACAGWVECSVPLARIGVTYHEWRRIKRRLVDVGLISPACEILP